MANKSVTEDERGAAHKLVLKLVRQKKYDDALALCTECIKKWPHEEKHFAWANLSYVQTSAGKVDEAMASLSAAVSLAPDDPAHRDARARLAIRGKAYGMAIEDSTALIGIELDRESVAFLESAFLLRAFAYLRLSEPDKALADLHRVKDAGPFRIDGCNLMKSELLSVAMSNKR